MKVAGVPLPLLVVAAVAGIVGLSWWRKRKAAAASAGAEPSLRWMLTGKPQAIFIDYPLVDDDDDGGPGSVTTIYNYFGFQRHGGGTPGGKVGGQPDTHDEPDEPSYPQPTSAPVTTEPEYVYEVPSRYVEMPIRGETVQGPF